MDKSAADRLTTPGLRSLPMKAGFVLLGSWLVAASAWIEVPMYPVPMTMQTYAILTIGALAGWRLGLATLLAYLAQGAMGLPMFAGGAGGAIHLIGPTGGYLLAFPLAAALTGWLVARAGRGLVGVTAAMLAGHGLILALGVAWLSILVGGEKAVALGLLPFLAGSVLKSVLGAATVVAAGRLIRRG